MGLDGIELLLAIEDEFQIAVTDKEAIECDTPAKLAALVYSKLRKSETDVCPSQRGFYKVRKTIMEQLNIPRNKIKPETPLHDLMQIKNRRKNWTKIISELAGEPVLFARLKRPTWLERAIFLFALLVAFPCFLYFSYYSFIFSFIATVLLIPMLMVITIPLKYDFPSNLKSVTDLIKIVGTLQTKAWDKDEVYNRVRRIISVQLGIMEEDIHPESHFVKDLGIG